MISDTSGLARRIGAVRWAVLCKHLVVAVDLPGEWGALMTLRRFKYWLEGP